MLGNTRSFGHDETPQATVTASKLSLSGHASFCKKVAKHNHISHRKNFTFSGSKLVTTNGVQTGPGAMQLHLIPFSAVSSAMPFVRVTMAPYKFRKRVGLNSAIILHSILQDLRERLPVQTVSVLFIPLHSQKKAWNALLYTTIGSITITYDLWLYVARRSYLLVTFWIH